MRRSSLFVREYAAAVFSIITILLTFASYWLPIPRAGVPFVMVLIPAVVAIGLAAFTDGRQGVKALLRQLTHWRIRLKWLGIALGTAFLMRLAISLAGVAFRLIPSVQLRPVTPAEVVMLALLFFIAAIPEELGWRGFALEKLLKGHTVWVASLMIGLMWGVVHLALHLPGMPSAGMSGYLTMLQLVGLSVLLSWLYVKGGRNIVLTSIFHAAQSFFVIINHGLNQNQQVWLIAIVYCCAAAFLLITSRVMRHRIKFAGLGHPV